MDAADYVQKNRQSRLAVGCAVVLPVRIQHNPAIASMGARPHPRHGWLRIIIPAKLLRFGCTRAL
ncbi:MAG: hypothetical protein ACE5FI_06925 [Anaerolineales bacterium]